MNLLSRYSSVLLTALLCLTSVVPAAADLKRIIIIGKAGEAVYR